MLIPWLLKYDGYPPGVVVALLLHGILLYIFMPKDFEPADRVTIQPMSYVVASAVTQSPQKLRRLDAQRRNEETQRDQQRRAEQQRREEQQRVVDQQRQEQEQQRAEQQRRDEQQRLAEQQRRDEEQRLAEQQRREEERRVADQQAAAAATLAANRAAANAQQQSVENQMVAQYMSIIHDLVSGAWRISPDARNGMLAVVQLRLTPTGDIITRQIVQSSGSATFDDSVLAAVDRVGSFPELKDMPSSVFDRHFRAGINLEFSPEDLLR